MRRCVLTLILVVGLSACVSWEQASIREAASAHRIRVHTYEGEVLDLYSPYLEGDTLLHGTVWPSSRPIVIPRAELRYAEVRTVDVAVSAMTAITLLGFIAAVVILHFPAT